MQKNGLNIYYGKKKSQQLNPSENIDGKGESASFQHFILFPQSFPSSHSVRVFSVLLNFASLKFCFMIQC